MKTLTVKTFSLRVLQRRPDDGL